MRPLGAGAAVSEAVRRRLRQRGFPKGLKRGSEGAKVPESKQPRKMADLDVCTESPSTTWETLEDALDDHEFTLFAFDAQ